MDYMAQAISLARLAHGQVSPNPAVGAVLVKNDIIIGQGYTQPPGGDHAEIVALKQAGREASGSTLFVTLEPCCHHGRTPPCTKSLIKAGISEVHFSIVDPNPKVAGKGQSELQQAGIKVYVGEQAEEATVLNEAFIKYITTGLPFVTVKFAASLDGKIATRRGDSKWVSGEAARKLVQHMRYEADAVMTGAGTVISDDPRLTVRIAVRGGITHKQPLRIIVDGQGRVPPTARLFKEPGQSLLVLADNLDDKIKRSFCDTGAEILEMPSEEGVINLKTLMYLLGKKEITNILVEAGGILLGSLFDNGMVDKVVAFLAPMIIGGEEARPAVAGQGFEALSQCPKLNHVKLDRVGDDIMVSGYVGR
jgi:diaminohydroxyphosphoribosylaminopyrimidine deaminase / 5-amino-6-(5-phosphoribosylamino)uracil reductase